MRRVEVICLDTSRCFKEVDREVLKDEQFLL